MKPPPARRLREVFAFSHLLRSCDLLLSVLIFVAHIRFEKCGGDLGPPAGLSRSHGVKSNAPGSAGALRRGESRGAPTSDPSLPCFFESASGGTQIRHTVTSGFAKSFARIRLQSKDRWFPVCQKRSVRRRRIRFWWKIRRGSPLLCAH